MSEQLEHSPVEWRPGRDSNDDAIWRFATATGLGKYLDFVAQRLLRQPYVRRSGPDRFSADQPIIEQLANWVEGINCQTGGHVIVAAIAYWLGHEAWANVLPRSDRSAEVYCTVDKRYLSVDVNQPSDWFVGDIILMSTTAEWRDPKELHWGIVVQVDPSVVIMQVRSRRGDGGKQVNSETSVFARPHVHFSTLESLKNGYHRVLVAVRRPVQLGSARTVDYA